MTDDNTISGLRATVATQNPKTRKSVTGRRDGRLTSGARLRVTAAQMTRTERGGISARFYLRS